MCGIAGLISRDGRPVDRDRLVGMVEAISHRGPDGEGIWMEGAVGLGHRRLAIVDLSETGRQPMRSEDGRYSIVFNGEIYNYQSLRTRLIQQGIDLKSHSDTEVILEGYRKWGVDVLQELHGMFAFAIWNSQEQSLFFARDRIGKKPFFFSNEKGEFRFASEIKSLLLDGRSEPDLQAVRLFLGLQYVPSDYSGFKGIQSLKPGHYGKWFDGKIIEGPKTYIEPVRLPAFPESEDSVIRNVRQKLEQAVKFRLIADVPVGCFLSGGVDSAAIACLATKLTGKPLQTFTMGFPSSGFDERKEAASLAKIIGADHHAFEVNPEEMIDHIDEIIELYDAPYADSSSIPTWFLARKTKSYVKAVLTGDGGDELFGGYRRYQHFNDAFEHRLLGTKPVISSVELFDKVRTLDPKIKRMLYTIHALERGDASGYAELFTGAYFTGRDLARLLTVDFALRTGGSRAESFIIKNIQAKGVKAALEFDLKSYLPDCLNVKMDRATMAHGLEARAPFLDQDLVSYAMRIPTKYLFKKGEQKPLLRKVLEGIVPNEVFNRPKRGFQVPLAEWFRGVLRPVFIARCLSSDGKLLSICRKEEVERYLRENDRGVDHGNRLWMLMSLATWLEKYA